MKNSADLGRSYPPRPSASVDNTLLDLQNSSYPTQPHSIIANYINTIEIPGSFLLLKPHIFTERREVTIFIFHAVKIFLLEYSFSDLHDTTVAFDKLTTGLRHKLFLVNQTYNSLTTVYFKNFP